MFKMFASALPRFAMAFSRFPSLLLILGAALALTACVVPPEEQPPQVLASGATLVGKEWVAMQIAGVEKVTEPAPRLRWTAPEQVAGSGGCNSFFGRAVIQQGAVLIGPLGATGRMCLALPQGGQEDRFFKALELARTARQSGAELVLEDGTGQLLLRFSAKP